VGDSLSDYSVLASVGPFDLYPAQEPVVAFAIVGGLSLEELQLHAHVAQLVYSEGFTDVPEQPAGEPVRLTCLRPNAPNPFARETVIRFDLTQTADVQLRVFDATGRLVRTLARGLYPPGRHALTWDGRGNDGHVLSAGIYFLRMRSDQEEACRRIILVR
jgi:hypothetical protein